MGNLETFLRGMETELDELPRRVRGRLETFLRGMETYHFGLQKTRSLDPLETFLRGMETVRGRAARFSRSTLKPSLEGWKHRLLAVVAAGGEEP